MAINTVPETITRIKAATPFQPISVFLHEVKNEEGKKQRFLNVCFARTIEAERMKTAIKPFHSSQRCKECGNIRQELAYEWLGDFHKLMNMNDVRGFLRTALGETSEPDTD